jgi:hypothetical protein
LSIDLIQILFFILCNLWVQSQPVGHWSLRFGALNGHCLDGLPIAEATIQDLLGPFATKAISKVI